MNLHRLARRVSGLKIFRIAPTSGVNFHQGKWGPLVASYISLLVLHSCYCNNIFSLWVFPFIHFLTIVLFYPDHELCPPMLALPSSSRFHNHRTTTQLHFAASSGMLSSGLGVGGERNVNTRDDKCKTSIILLVTHYQPLFMDLSPLLLCVWKSVQPSRMNFDRSSYNFFTSIL